jgi:hypothetical protein
MARMRLAASLLIAVTASTLAATAAPALAAAPVTHDRGQAASGWLARQMTGASHFTDTFDGKTYPDQGTTINAILAFAATRTARGYTQRAEAWLGRPSILSNYVGNGSTESYAGATAKLMLAAEVGGLNPARFGSGHVNLPARLARLLTKSGRYSDHSSFGDFSNAFSQALAVIATSRRGGAPATAVGFLSRSECSGGAFPLDFAQKKCTGDADATAMDVQAFLAAGWTGAAQRGLHWLARVQRAGGGLTETSGAPDANSTGLAGEAFAAGGWPQRAALARRFLLRLQVGCAGPAARRGAIALNQSGYRASTAALATSQAILGLADVSLVKVSGFGAHRGDPRLACS